MHAAAWLLSSSLLIAPAAATDPGPPPAGPEADAVPALLAEAGIGYEVDDDGDYRIVYAWEREGRSQLVYVSGHAEEAAGRRIREVFSPAAHFRDGSGHGGGAEHARAGGERAGIDHPGPTPELARQLLRDSRTRKLGAWELDGDVLYYVIKLPEPLDATLLHTAVSAAAEIADERERALSGDRDAL